jgi:hypothetical protein
MPFPGLFKDIGVSETTRLARYGENGYVTGSPTSTLVRVPYSPMPWSRPRRAATLSASPSTAITCRSDCWISSSTSRPLSSPSTSA